MKKFFIVVFALTGVAFVANYLAERFVLNQD